MKNNMKTSQSTGGEPSTCGKKIIVRETPLLNSGASFSDSAQFKGVPVYDCNCEHWIGELCSNCRRKVLDAHNKRRLNISNDVR